MESRLCSSQSEYNNLFPLNILRQPSNTVSVALPHDNGAHENLDGSDVAFKRHLALTGGLVQSKGVLELELGNGLGHVDLVSKNQEGHSLELLNGKQRVELGLGLGESSRVGGIDEENNAVDLGKVVLPHSSGLDMSTEIKGCEFTVADGQLLGGGVHGGVRDGHSVVLEHVQQGGLSGVIETEEEQLGVLVP